MLGFLGAGNLGVHRLLRPLRMLKLTHHSTVLSLLWAVIPREAHSITAPMLFSASRSLSGALASASAGSEGGGWIARK